jgi:alpha-galactosidase
VIPAADAGQPAVSPLPATFKGPVKVFILAGQSNMEGHAGVQTLDRLGEHPTHAYLAEELDVGNPPVRFCEGH